MSRYVTSHNEISRKDSTKTECVEIFDNIDNITYKFHITFTCEDGSIKISIKSLNTEEYPEDIEQIVNDIANTIIDNMIGDIKFMLNKILSGNDSSGDNCM